MKQAFLIIAHNHFDHLERLIKAIDNPDAFFYILIDAKVDIPISIKEIITTNPIKILHSVKVEWGNQSLIKAELELFNNALKNKEIEWFHLISGTDFPLRPVGDIMRFFETSANVDCFMETEPIPAHLVDRMEIYHFVVNRPSEMDSIKSFFQKAIGILQLRLGIKRKSPLKHGFMYGSAWVDLRRSAVKLLLDNYELIMRTTKYTQCADEIYKQTFLHDRGLIIVNDNLRYIDWSARQPSPKSLKPEDFRSLTESGKLFARKFDDVESPILCDMISERIS